MSLDGVLYPVIVEEARLKLGLISTHKCPVRTLSGMQLKLHTHLIHSCNVSTLKVLVETVTHNI